MSTLKNFREVGLFDVLIAPLSPLQTFDAERFKTEAAQMLEGSTTNLVVDLAGMDFLYSDAYNAIMVIQARVAEKNGVFGILTNNEIIVKGLQQAGLDRLVQVFAREADIMGFSLSANKKAELRATDIERIERPSAVLSQNAGHAESVKPKNHRVTQSFNSSASEDNVSIQGMGDPFTGSHPVVETKRSALWTVLGVLAGLAVIVGLLMLVR